jgi:hypothetical protein
MSFTPFVTPAALNRETATAAGGFALVNGTPNVITWTAPNDGQPHLFQLTAVMHVTVAETGGEIDLAFTAPDGTVVSGVVVFASALTPGISAAFFSRLCQPGTIVTVSQATALTLGAARLDAVIWGS